jgi:hypothetical protein
MIPTKNPSITSFESMFLMYRIPKNPVTIIRIIGVIIFISGNLDIKKGVIIFDRMSVTIHINIP